MEKIISFLCILMLSFSLFAQDLFTSPESAAFYEEDNCYFISNKAGGNIIKIDSLGNQSIFNEDQNSVRGITVLNEKIYAASNAGLAVINANTGIRDTLIEISGESFLNGICHNNQRFVYLSDTNVNKIFRVDTQTNNVETLISGEINSPNGLLFEEENNRILVVVWQGNASVYALSLDSYEISEIIETGYHNLDGIAKDSSNNYYISSWGENAVIKYSEDFEEIDIFSDNHSGPADIMINNLKNELVVPNFNSNSVDFINLESNQIEDSEINNYFKLNQNYPNPFILNNSRSNFTNISFELKRNSIIDLEIYDLRGRVINILLNNEIFKKGFHEISWNGTNYSGEKVSSGVYLIKIKNNLGESQINKCTILK